MELCDACDLLHSRIRDCPLRASNEERNGMFFSGKAEHEVLGAKILPKGTSVMDAIRSLCGRCVVMNSGRRIAEGRPDEVLADPAVIEAYLGVSTDA